MSALSLQRFIQGGKHEVTLWVRLDGPPTKAELKLKEVQHVQNPTVAWARRNGFRAVKLQGMGNRSQPDYMFAADMGTLVFIEFKRPGQEPTPLQTHCISEWQKDGFTIEVHDTKDSAIAFLKKVKEALSEVV